MSGNSPISIAEATGRALWLVKLSLLDQRRLPEGNLHGASERNFDDDPRIALKVFLLRSGIADEVVASRVARGLAEKPPGLSRCAEWLCERMLTLRHGVPELLSQPLARRLASLIDPDGLLCFHPEFRPPEGERYDWAAIPVRATAEVAPVLREGSVDTHVHLGGALPPLYYWVLMMSGEVPLIILQSFATVERGHAEQTAWTEAIRRAMWLRLHLAARLQMRRRGKAFPHLPPAECDLWKPFLEPAPPAFSRAVQDAALCLSAQQRYYKAKHGGGSRDRRPGRLPSTDPLLHERLEDASHFGAGERRLLCLASDFLRNDPSTDIEKPLLEYLRIRNATYQAMVLGAGGSGLARFREVNRRRSFMYDRKRPRQGARRRRISRLARRLVRHQMVATLEAQLNKAFDGSGRQRFHAPRRAIEIRVAVVPGRSLLPTLRSWLEAIQEHVRGVGGPPRNAQAGLVFLLKKGGPDQRARAAYDTLRLKSLLTTYPELRPWIVGIDVAGSERATPPRGFIESYERLCELERSQRPRPGELPTRLGRTYHVGEDVDDLLTGLRHIDEAVRLLLGPGGGRLGHALVLGEDPGRFYARRRGQTEPRLGTHLLDLVWAWGLFTDERRAEEADWLARHVHELAGSTSQVRACSQAMQRTDPAFNENELLKVLNFSGNSKAHQTIQADDEWLKLVGQLQGILRYRLARQRICVEANPTSNLLIADYLDYHELPYRTLVDAGLALSLNTDDPGLFMTSLPGEFAAMYGALAGKMDYRETLCWLSNRVDDAWQSTFLDHQTPSGADVLAYDLGEIFRPRG